MRRQVLVPSVVSTCLAALSILVVLFASGAPASASATAPAAAPAAAKTQQSFITFYGWWDNTPPGAGISYPKIHSTAGGTGTYADPITFATSKSEIAPGGKIFVPRVGKYFIMEDDCGECDADWSGKGPDGGPKLWHFDLWLGGKGGNAIKAIECEDALTNYNADGTPSMESVIINPPSNETVSSQPIFNTKTGECYGGATPITTIGQYKNKGGGLCLDDPNNSTKNGFTLAAAACGGATEQQFTFDGTFLSIHSLCADSSGGKILFKTCTGGPTQQWSANTNGTISDIQTGKKCFRVSGTTVTAGSCSGAAAQWTFPTTTVPPTKK